MAKPPWKRFAVGKPGAFANDCRSLTTVSHVAHLETASRIIEDGRVRADLVFDESKLKKRRIRVVWLSPNDWTNAGGFRYGNIRFTFRWESLIKGKSFFWVEHMTYQPEACRILVTDREHMKKLEPYDPTSGDGPWWHAPDGNHYWNGNYTLEIMFESDIDLKDAKDVDFVRHHPNRCSIDWRTCPFKRVSADIAGARLLAGLTARMIAAQVPGLLNEDGSAGNALEGAMAAMTTTLRKATKGGSWGSITRASTMARAVARAALSALSNPDFAPDVRILALQFASEAELQGAVADAVAGLLGAADGDTLLRS